MEVQESLGKRMKKFIALVAIVFTLTTAVVVTQRLSADALALLIGVTVGIVMMVPTLGLGWLVWRREVARGQAQQQHFTPTNAAPPVVVVTPQAMPYGGQYGALGSGNNHGTNPHWQAAPAERQFTIVGGEE